jgi:hypothetical protein
MVKDQTKSKTEEQDVTKSKDFARFIATLQAVGKLPEDFDFEGLSDEQKRNALIDYTKWVEMGRPKPQMPQTEQKQERILRVYRRRSFGEEKLTAVVDGQAVQMGIELVPIYAKNKDGSIDYTNQIGTERKYTIPYTPQKAKELVDRCKKESTSPKFYIAEETGKTYRIRIEDNFYRNFDEVIKDALSGKTI